MVSEFVREIAKIHASSCRGKGAAYHHHTQPFVPNEKRGPLLQRADFAGKCQDNLASLKGGMGTLGFLWRTLQST